MINLLYFALAVAASSPESVSSIPTIEQAEVDPKYQRVESRQLAGRCAEMNPLANMLSTRDGVKKIVQVACDNVMFSPPTDDNTNSYAALMAFVMSGTKKGTYFRGSWVNGDLNLQEISFDQLNWYKVSKGRVRIYKSDKDGTTLFVGFAVFENGERQGVAFRFES